jgi:hypothetical protein
MGGINIVFLLVRERDALEIALLLSQQPGLAARPLVAERYAVAHIGSVSRVEAVKAADATYKHGFLLFTPRS